MGLESESAAFHEMLQGVNAWETKTQDWEAGVELAESTLQTLKDLPSSLETRAFKVGGIKLLERMVEEMKSPPEAPDKLDTHGAVVLLRESGYPAEADTTMNCVNAAERLDAGDLSQIEHKKANAELKSVIKSFEAIPATNSIHDSEAKSLLEDLSFKFEANYDLALSEREVQHRSTIDALQSRVEHLNSVESEKNTVDQEFLNLKQTSSELQSELEKVQMEKEEAQKEMQRYRDLYDEYSTIDEEAKKEKTALTLEVETLKLSVVAPNRREAREQHGQTTITQALAGVAPRCHRCKRLDRC